MHDHEQNSLRIPTFVSACSDDKDPTILTETTDMSASPGPRLPMNNTTGAIRGRITMLAYSPGMRTGLLVTLILACNPATDNPTAPPPQ